LVPNNQKPKGSIKIILDQILKRNRKRFYYIEKRKIYHKELGGVNMVAGKSSRTYKLVLAQRQCSRQEGESLIQTKSIGSLLRD
jgi:hypothetical protein